MTAYFASDGSLKYTNKTRASMLNATKTSASDDVASASSASSGSSFSKEMKNAALQAAGKSTTEMKNAARASNADYQRFALLQARVQKIAARKPRTFEDESPFTINMKAITNYSAAQEKYNSKTGSRSASGSSSSSTIAAAKASASSHVYGQRTSNTAESASTTVAGYNKDILKTFI